MGISSVIVTGRKIGTPFEKPSARPTNKLRRPHIMLALLIVARPSEVTERKTTMKQPLRKLPWVVASLITNPKSCKATRRLFMMTVEILATRDTTMTEDTMKLPTMMMVASTMRAVMTTEAIMMMEEMMAIIATR